MQTVIILGSTGNLGMQAIEVLAKYSNKFKIIGLSANTSQKLLHEQAKKYKISNKNIALASRDGEKSVEKLACHKEADIIINVISGINGIKPTLKALEKNKIVLLGNKESLVAEGKKVMTLAKKAFLIPLDSEHNSIYEIFKKQFGAKFRLPLTKEQIKAVKKIYLSCSGGPFLGKNKKFLQTVCIKDVLNHPKWKMGGKISVESALLLNKGLEIIEAHYFFGLPINKIDVFVSPQCRVHAIVDLKKNNISFGGVSARAKIETNFPKNAIAYIAPPDMREHIENALLAVSTPGVKHKISKYKFGSSPRQIHSLKKNEFKFFAPDHKTFPGIKIVLKNFKKNPQKMENFLGKEEKTIKSFLEGKISFLDIAKLLG